MADTLLSNLMRGLSKKVLPASTVIHMRKSGSAPTPQEFNDYVAAKYPPEEWDTSNISINNLLWWDIS